MYEQVVIWTEWVLRFSLYFQTWHTTPLRLSRDRKWKRCCNNIWHPWTGPPSVESLGSWRSDKNVSGPVSRSLSSCANHNRSWRAQRWRYTQDQASDWDVTEGRRLLFPWDVRVPRRLPRGWAVGVSEVLLLPGSECPFLLWHCLFCRTRCSRDTVSRFSCSCKWDSSWYCLLCGLI